jgi:hypothetical protein
MRAMTRDSQSQQEPCELQRLWEHGFSVVPCHRTTGQGAKIPCVRWKEFQERKACREEIEQWLHTDLNPNVAIVTGAVSGIVVIDCDSQDAVRAMENLLNEPTPTVATARGCHFYFQHPGGRIPNVQHLYTGMDVRGDGGYVLAPDSIHPSGRHYEWIVSPWEAALVAMPPTLLSAMNLPQYQTGSTDAAHRIGAGQFDVRVGDSSSTPWMLRTSARLVRQCTRYGAAALAGELRRLHEIPLAEGNNKQYRMAQASYRMGQLVPSGCVSREEVFDAFLDVWCDRWAKPHAQGVRTITAGLNAGRETPRVAARRPAARR